MKGGATKARTRVKAQIEAGTTASESNKKIQIGSEGTRGPGRPAGSPNLMTRSAREIALNLLRTNAEEAQLQLDKLKKYPRVWLSFYLRIGRLLIPRTHSEGSSPLVNINLGSAPIATAADAARVYAHICGDPSIPLDGLTFAAPAQLEHESAAPAQSDEVSP
jgi:hypothetical protein